jgi:very-short-patch-repair endonuclease
VRPRYIAYRARLTRRPRDLRREQTPAERKLWYEFLAGLPQKFTRQKPLGSYIADFYCAQQLLVIELDGDSHYIDSAAAYDNARAAALNARGIRVVRFNNSDVMERFEGVCNAILAEFGKG